MIWAPAELKLENVTVVAGKGDATLKIGGSFNGPASSFGVFLVVPTKEETSKTVEEFLTDPAKGAGKTVIHGQNVTVPDPNTLQCNVKAPGGDYMLVVTQVANGQLLAQTWGKRVKVAG
jgi:hypothetical protein